MTYLTEWVALSILMNDLTEWVALFVLMNDLTEWVTICFNEWPHQMSDNLN